MVDSTDVVAIEMNMQNVADVTSVGSSNILSTDASIRKKITTYLDIGIG